MNPMTTADGPFWKLLRYGPWVGAAIFLLLPLVAMQVSEEVQWTAFDFAAAGVMFLSVLIPWELANRGGTSIAYRLGVAVALGTGLLVVWSSLAVGIVGSEDDAANLMFFLVLGMAFVVAAVSGFRARGLFAATATAALLQIAVGAVALLGRMGATDPSWPVDVLGATGVFTLGWLLSAGLFGRAARDAVEAQTSARDRT